MRILQYLMLIGLGCSLGGCAIAGWTADVIASGTPIKPVYDLADRPTVVMVDDPTNKLTTYDLSNLIAGRVGDALVREKVIERANMVAANRISQIAADNSAFRTWPIDKVGKEAGAEQVIYVVIQQFDLADDSGTYRPVAEARVKVIDVPSGQRLYPNAREGHPVGVQQFFQAMDGSNRSTEAILGRRLAEELAVEIGYLFHEHLPPQQGSKLPG